MQALVLAEERLVSKRLSTNIASVRLLPRVGPDVGLQVAGLDVVLLLIIMSSLENQQNKIDQVNVNFLMKCKILYS